MRAARWLCVPAAMLAVGAGALSAPAAASTAGPAAMSHSMVGPWRA